MDNKDKILTARERFHRGAVIVYIFRPDWERVQEFYHARGINSEEYKRAAKVLDATCDKLEAELNLSYEELKTANELIKEGRNSNSRITVAVCIYRLDNEMQILDAGLWDHFAFMFPAEKRQAITHSHDSFMAAVKAEAAHVMAVED